MTSLIVSGCLFSFGISLVRTWFRFRGHAAFVGLVNPVPCPNTSFFFLVQLMAFVCVMVTQPSPYVLLMSYSLKLVILPESIFIPAAKNISINLCPNSKFILLISAWFILSLKKGRLSISIRTVPLFTDLRQFEIFSDTAGGLVDIPVFSILSVISYDGSHSLKYNWYESNPRLTVSSENLK